MTFGDTLRRGLAAGAVAGLLAGIFALLVGEVPVREAIRLEEADTATSSVDEPPLVDRTTQQALLPVATVVVGAAFGGLFALGWAAVRRRVQDHSDWRAALKLGGATWAAVALFPGLVYPANPPAVGDPATIGSRSGSYLAAIALGLVTAVVLWRLTFWLRDRRMPDVPRQLLVGLATVVAIVVLLVVLPAAEPATGVPAQLLWEFRLASLATQLILWSGIAVTFGWFAHRAQVGDAGRVEPS
jgi:predicted cobalt transporter CbtA